MCGVVFNRFLLLDFNRTTSKHFDIIRFLWHVVKHGLDSLVKHGLDPISKTWTRLVKHGPD